MEGTMTFGQGMKAAREKKGLSQAELARVVGLSRAAICGYEKMRRTNISFPIAFNICRTLDMNINDYFPNERSMNMCNNENCEKKVKDALGEEELKFFLDGHIDEYEEDVVTIPRSEYDDLMYSAVLLDILHRLYKTVGKYTMGDLLANIFSGDEAEKEDGHE